MKLFLMKNVWDWWKRLCFRKYNSFRFSIQGSLFLKEKIIEKINEDYLLVITSFAPWKMRSPASGVCFNDQVLTVKISEVRRVRNKVSYKYLYQFSKIQKKIGSSVQHVRKWRGSAVRGVRLFSFELKRCRIKFWSWLGKFQA